MADSKKQCFSKSPILKKISRNFHRLVLGLVGLIDEKLYRVSHINALRINQFYQQRTNPWNFHNFFLRIGYFEKHCFFESAILNFFDPDRIFWRGVYLCFNSLLSNWIGPLMRTFIFKESTSNAIVEFSVSVVSGISYRFQPSNCLTMSDTSLKTLILSIIPSPCKKSMIM